jgi:hypothetical protein
VARSIKLIEEPSMMMIMIELVGPTYQKKSMNAARMDKLILGCWRNCWEAAYSTMRKQKWLLMAVNGCKQNSPFSTKQEFLKLVTR